MSNEKKSASEAFKKLRELGAGKYWDSVKCICAELGRGKCEANCPEWTDSSGNGSTLFDSHLEALAEIIRLKEENKLLLQDIEEKNGGQEWLKRKNYELLMENNKLREKIESFLNPPYTIPTGTGAGHTIKLPKTNQ